MSPVQPRPNLQLQQASWDQLDAVMEVMNRSFDPGFGEAWSRAQCAGILPMNGVVMTLACDQSTPVGFSLARSVADEAELLLLAVAPEARRSGVATRLLEHFTAIAASRGARRLHLEVRDGNPAVQLYVRHGFRVEGRRPGYYRGGDGNLFDALTMARPTRTDSQLRAD
jgi:ribosomal-protein-alanine N-acetyltransferase